MRFLGDLLVSMTAMCFAMFLFSGVVGNVYFFFVEPERTTMEVAWAIMPYYLSFGVAGVLCWFVGWINHVLEGER